MPNIPCEKFTNCPNPANPITNYSTEAPDFFTYLSLQFPWLDPNNPVSPNNYYKDGCQSECHSAISQADADLCAARQAFICAHTPPPGTPGNPPPPVFYFNNLQACSFSCPDGTVFTYRVFGGSFVDITQAGADEKAAAYACAAAGFFSMCLSNLPGVCLNTPYAQTITTSRTNNPPYTFAITSGSLPPGLSSLAVPNGLAITGTPTVAGNYTFTVQATDASGNTISKAYTLGVFGITNSPPSATKGTAYAFAFTAAGGVAPYTYSLASGALPDGLSMDSAGNITGTPTTAATFNFTVQVNDSSP